MLEKIEVGKEYKSAKCRSDLKIFVCGKMSRKSVDYRVLCGDPVIVSLPDSEEE